MSDIDSPGSSERDLHFSLLEALLNDRSPSENAVKFVVQKLDDPHLEASAAKTISLMREPPLYALSHLFDKLVDAKDEGLKEVLVTAIGTYGSIAQNYLSELEQMMHHETIEVTRDNFKRAIQNIRHPSASFHSILPSQQGENSNTPSASKTVPEGKPGKK
jgi:hypothetical protein